MAFGLTDSGFNKKSLADILADMNARVEAIFGPANVAPDSVFGQFNGIMAEVAGDIWDLADLTYTSQYALASKGVSLDSVAELNNLSRLAATSSSATVILDGDELTLVPAGTQVKQASTGEVFETASDITLAKANLLKAVISVNDFATAPHTIDITAGASTDNYSSVVTSSAVAVLQDFETQINSGGNHKAVLDISAETLTITNILATNIISFEIAIDATLDLDEQWTPVAASAVNTGSLAVPTNSIQTIETPVAGLNSVDNLAAGVQGRDTETDDEFRVRRKQSLRVVGAATVPAMEARLVQELESVVSATVKDNRTDAVDSNGRPPHSFEAIITFSPNDAPTRQLIADKLWEIKPAGIETFGGITESVVDSTGDLQTINFSRPTDKYLHIICNITLNPEEVFPSDGLAAIGIALADFGNELRAGEDCIRQRFFNSVYSVSGVKDIPFFQFAVTENPGDTPGIIAAETITAEPFAGIYTMAGATIVTAGVVSGMVVRRGGPGIPITSVQQVTAEDQFTTADDPFNVSDSVEFGDFGETNIGINDNEIARFDTARIAVYIV